MSETQVERAVRHHGDRFTHPDEREYRKKPVIVRAFQTPVPLEIETLEGVMRAAPGDFIITGVNGEQYPCKPDIFNATYEAA